MPRAGLRRRLRARGKDSLRRRSARLARRGPHRGKAAAIAATNCSAKQEVRPGARPRFDRAQSLVLTAGQGNEAFADAARESQPRSWRGPLEKTQRSVVVALD